MNRDPFDISGNFRYYQNMSYIIEDDSIHDYVQDVFNPNSLGDDIQQGRVPEIIKPTNYHDIHRVMNLENVNQALQHINNHDTFNHIDNSMPQFNLQDLQAHTQRLVDKRDGDNNEGGLMMGGSLRKLREISTLKDHHAIRSRMIIASYDMDNLVNQHLEEDGLHYTTADNEDVNLSEKTIFGDPDNGKKILRQNNLGDWKINTELSTKQYLVMEQPYKSGRPKIELVFRGQPGPNAVDAPHLHAALTGDLLGNRDYSNLDKLYRNVTEMYGANADIKVTSYSNGGPKGVYMAETYGLDHVAIDPVLGPKEGILISKRNSQSANFELLRTPQPSLPSAIGSTVSQIAGGDNYVNVVNVEPGKGYYEMEEVSEGVFQEVYKKTNLLDPLSGHDLRHYTDTTTDRMNIGALGRGAVQQAAIGLLPMLAASALVEKIAPNQPQAAKLGEEVVAASAITKVAAPLLGMGAAPMATTLAPLAAGTFAGVYTSQAVKEAIPEAHGMSGRGTDILREGAAEAAGGAVGGLATGIAGAALAGMGIGAASTAELGPLALGGAALGAVIGTGIGIRDYVENPYTQEQLQQQQHIREYQHYLDGAAQQDRDTITRLQDDYLSQHAESITHLGMSQEHLGQMTSEMSDYERQRMEIELRRYDYLRDANSALYQHNIERIFEKYGQPQPQQPQSYLDSSISREEVLRQADIIADAQPGQEIPDEILPPEQIMVA